MKSGWTVTAYRGAPVVPLWTPPPAFAWIPAVVMPVAFVLVEPDPPSLL